MPHDQKHKQAFERERGDQAKIDARDGVCMIAQEGLPTLRWRPTAPDHVFGHRRLGDFEAELEQLAMDAGRAPQGILVAHSSDELA